MNSLWARSRLRFAWQKWHPVDGQLSLEILQIVSDASFDGLLLLYRKLHRPLALSSFPSAAPSTTPAPRKQHKNWDGITTNILGSEKELTTDQDPNVGGDSTLNGFFQKIFGDADDDTKRAMMKSYQESGGTALSTNWDEVKKAPVEVKPPAGSEWKKWN